MALAVKPWHAVERNWVAMAAVSPGIVMNKLLMDASVHFVFVLSTFPGSGKATNTYALPPFGANVTFASV